VLAVLPFILSEGGVPSCPEVQFVRDLHTGAMGVTQTSDFDNCAIRVIDNSNYLFFLQIPKGSYRFFQDIVQVACVDQGDGVYVECGADTPFTDVIPLEVDLDIGLEMDIIHQEGVVGGSTRIYQNPFEDFFKNKFNIVITIVVIVVVGIIGCIITFVLLKCGCGLLKSHWCGSSTKVRVDLPRGQELGTSVVPTIGGRRTE
jgi:hypothetical protein